MRSIVKGSLIALAFLAATSSSAQNPTVEPRQEEKNIGPLQRALRSGNWDPEGKEDPPGIMNQRELGSIRELAARLSSERNWLTAEVLQRLSEMSVRLDEVFSAAPELVKLDGRVYRILLEKVGPGWEDFDRSSSEYLVFLNHEVYDGFGENYALGFQDGREKLVVREDITKTPSVGITLTEVTPEESSRGRQKVVSAESPLCLGKVRSPRSPLDSDRTAYRLPNLITAKSSCLYESAPTACVSGVPTCSSPNATPYFVLTRIMIRKDNEDDTFRGNPEIELFPLRVDPNSPPGGSSNARTNWIFSGRTVTDLAGRSVYLPDVNSTNTWYNINNLAVFPANLSHEWVSTLVEDDDETGLLKMQADKVNVVKAYKSINNIVTGFTTLDFHKLLNGAQFFLDLAYNWGDGDDLFVQSLGVTNELFCTDGLGQAFPRNFVLSGTEWDLQGYFACIDPTCVQDPCGGDPCCGDPCCGDPCCSGTGFCN